MKKFFDFFIADEVHELANAVTIQGNTFGTLAAASRWTLALTGTVIGGKAVDLHAPMWRMAPDLLTKRAFNLHIFRESKIGPVAQNEKNFTMRYGVMEYITTRDAAENYKGYTERGATGRRKSFKTVERIRPGISPDLFNHFLMGRGVFMGLSELGPALPTIERKLFPCKPDDELAANYNHLDKEFQEALKKTCRTKGPSNVAGMRVQVLDAYLDRPWGWNPISIQAIDKEGNEYTKHIADPVNMEENRIGNKEREMLKFIKAEVAAGRRCCVYPVFTQRHNVREKLQNFLTANGIKTVCLPDGVSPLKREEWIMQNMSRMDVLIVHPRRVMTGLDLVQFPTLIWYQVGYSTHTLRQASARARRPTQKLPCKVAFFYYKGTIQEQALALMGEKESAAQALEGVFDTRALKAMMNGGENDDVLSALANGLEASKPASETWRVIDEAENPTSAPQRAAPHTNTVASLNQQPRESDTYLWDPCLKSSRTPTTRTERRVEQLAMFG